TAASSAAARPVATPPANTPSPEPSSALASWPCCPSSATEKSRESRVGSQSLDSPLLMPTPFHTTRLVEFSDTDMAGIMHFSAFFRYMEAAEHELLRSMGFSVYSEIDGHPVSFPRVAASCEYHSPAKCEDTLSIDVTVRR